MAKHVAKKHSKAKKCAPCPAPAHPVAPAVAVVKKAKAPAHHKKIAKHHAKKAHKKVAHKHTAKRVAKKVVKKAAVAKTPSKGHHSAKKSVQKKK